MNLTEFCEKYKVKAKKDTCDDYIIVGKAHKAINAKRREDNPHIYEANGKIWAFLVFNTKAKWNSVKKRLLVASAKNNLNLRVNAEAEGIVEVEVDNPSFVTLLFKIARIRVKREMSDEQKAKIRERFNKLTRG